MAILERGGIDHGRGRYPYSLVWTPIPLLTWIFPFVGHMGIAYSTGVVRDFAGPYQVSEDNLAFGKATRYLPLDVSRVPEGQESWDRGVYDASEEYKGRMHNLFCDNCHSHVSLALNLMRYNEKNHWNMVKLAAWMFFQGRFVGLSGFVKTFLPTVILYTVVVIFSFLLSK